MSISIRTPNEGDFFAWLGLYEGYAQTYQVALTDEKALRLWTWLTDAAHTENALIAVDDNGDLVGLVHFHTFPRPLQSTNGMFIDDVFVQEDARRHGVGRALIDAVVEAAGQQRCDTVRWISAPTDADARALYDEVAAASDLIVYERVLVPAEA